MLINENPVEKSIDIRRIGISWPELSVFGMSGDSFKLSEVVNLANRAEESVVGFICPKYVYMFRTRPESHEPGSKSQGTRR